MPELPDEIEKATESLYLACSKYGYPYMSVVMSKDFVADVRGYGMSVLSWLPILLKHASLEMGDMKAEINKLIADMEGDQDA